MVILAAKNSDLLPENIARKRP